MRTGLMVKHDVETRRHAAELFDSGVGRRAASRAPSVPKGTVRQWRRIYRAPGSEALLAMGGRRARYTHEQKVTAASTVVDGGATKADAMAELHQPRHVPAGRPARPAAGEDAGGREARAALGHGLAHQHAGWCGRSKAVGIVQSMSRKGGRIDNGATEQVFVRIKDEFSRGRKWPDFESFGADLDGYVVHWNTRRFQVKLRGLSPEEFRSQSLA